MLHGESTFRRSNTIRRDMVYKVRYDSRQYPLSRISGRWCYETLIVLSHLQAGEGGEGDITSGKKQTARHLSIRRHSRPLLPPFPRSAAPLSRSETLLGSVSRPPWLDGNLQFDRGESERPAGSSLPVTCRSTCPRYVSSFFERD